MVVRLCGLFLAILLFPWSHALSLDTFAPDKIIPYKTIGDVTLNLHVFEPENHQSSDRRPTIVFYFGGGWVGGNPNQFYPHCHYLAERGMVAISAEYRTKSIHNTPPSVCVADGKSAIRWIRQHAEELGIDQNSIVAGGGSAGGHIAAATATLTHFDDPSDDINISCVPNALALFNPVFDNGPEGYGHDRVVAYWQDFSPIHNLNAKTPPTIIFLGTEDNLIPVQTAEEYQSKMKAFGIRCDLHLYEDQAHGFFNYRNTTYYNKTINTLDDFLVSLNLLPVNND